MAVKKYFLGSMYAGKSTKAIDYLLTCNHKNKIIVSSSQLTRGYISRNHNTLDLPEDILIFPDLLVAISKIEKLIRNNEDVVLFVDEFQFTNSYLIDKLLSYSDNNKLDLILAGLEVDQYNKPFTESLKVCRAYEDSVERVSSTCKMCDSKEGRVSVRKWKTDDMITDEYSIMCESCFNKFFY